MSTTNETESRMESRVLTREEQDKIDKRQKNCAQYTWFLVTPEAQAEYLKKNKLPAKPATPSSSKKSPAKKAATPKAKTPTATPAKSPRTKSTPKVTPKATPKATPKVRKAANAKARAEEEKDVPESEDEVEPDPAVDDSSEQDSVRVPLRKFDAILGRLASALLLLPTSDPARSKESHQALLEVAQEMRELRPPTNKRPFKEDGEDGGAGTKKKRRL
ncbi:hypothetical protein B0H19DRAFT_1247476 [Mycena capillaripes]|nr:hypothetical protein B0H19DRAFT_1247476 [Mycena capillaripes]